MVISEAIKQRFNQGLASNLYFWRNNTSEEADLLLEEGDQLRPIEMKSSQTFHSSFLDCLLKWARYGGDTAMPARLVCGGEGSMVRSGVAVRSWRGVQVD